MAGRRAVVSRAALLILLQALLDPFVALRPRQRAWESEAGSGRGPHRRESAERLADAIVWKASMAPRF